MAETAFSFTYADRRIYAKGSGFPPGGRLWLVVKFLATNGDTRSERLKLQIAGPVPDPDGPPGATIPHPVFDHGVVDGDWSWPWSGTITWMLLDDPEDELSTLATGVLEVE